MISLSFYFLVRYLQYFPVPAVVYMSPLSFRMRASTGNAVIDIAVPMKTKKLMKLTLAYFGSFFCIKGSEVFLVTVLR